jgi:hypothetical protein
MKICEFIFSLILFLLALPFILTVVLLLLLRVLFDKIVGMLVIIFITIPLCLLGFKDLLFKTNSVNQLNELTQCFYKNKY